MIPKGYITAGLVENLFQMNNGSCNEQEIWLERSKIGVHYRSSILGLQKNENNRYQGCCSNNLEINEK